MCENLLFDYLDDYYKKFYEIENCEISGAELYSSTDDRLEYNVKWEREDGSMADYEEKEYNFHWLQVVDFVYEKFKSEIQTLKDEIQALKEQINN